MEGLQQAFSSEPPTKKYADDNGHEENDKKAGRLFVISIKWNFYIHTEKTCHQGRHH